MWLILFFDSDACIEELKLYSIFQGDNSILLDDFHHGMLDTDLNVALESELCGIAQYVYQNLLKSLIVTFDLSGDILLHITDEEYLLLEQ